MKRVLTLLFLTFAAIGTAQTCIPLDNVVWVNRHLSVDPTSGAYTSYYERFTTHEEDTLIDGVSYRKLYNDYGYLGGIRADTVRAWVFHKDSTHESLAIDFSAMIGDTIFEVFTSYFGGRPTIIDSWSYISDRDTIWTNGIAQIVLEINGGDREWIQYVGSRSGMFWEMPINTLDNSYDLFCLSVSDTTVYPQRKPGICPTSIGVESYQESSQRVYPVPANDFLHLSNVDNGSTVVVYDLTGNSVLETSLQNGRVNVSRLPKGAYVVRVMTLQNEIKSFRALIQR